MSFANKFLDTGSKNVSDGTLILFGSKIGAKNLISTSANTVKIDSGGNLFAAPLNAIDVSGVVANPMTEDLNINDNNILNSNTVEISNGSNSITLNYSSGIIDQDLDLQDVKDIDNATQNINATTTSGQTDFDGDVTIQNDLQIGGDLIGTLTINDIDTGGAQTNDLNVNLTNSSIIVGPNSVGNNWTTSGIAKETGGNLESANSKLTGVINNTGQIITNTTGIALESGNLATIVTNTTGIALESGGNLATIVTNTGNIDTKLGGIIQIQSNFQDIATESTANSIDSRLAGNIKVIEQNANFSTAMTNLASGIVQVQSNSANIATESTLSTIDSKQSAIVSSTSSTASSNSSIATSTGNINTKIPSQGQTTQSGSMPVVLSNDYASTLTSKNLLSTLRLSTASLGELAANYGSATTVSFNSWAGSGTGECYITKIKLYIELNSTGPKLDGWGSSVTKLTNGFNISYKSSSTSSDNALTGTILSLGQIMRDLNDFSIFIQSATCINATMDLSNNPIFINNLTGTKGLLNFNVIGADNLTLNNTTSVRIRCEYYYS